MPDTTVAHRTIVRGIELSWLTEADDWAARVKALADIQDPAEAWQAMEALANHRLDFLQTNRLDGALRKRFGEVPPPGVATRPVRLAVLGSATLGHLLAGIRVAGLRRGIWIKTHEGDYGQYLTELRDRDSSLHAFAPDLILFAMDGIHMTRGLDVTNDAAGAATERERSLEHLRQCWRAAREAFGCPVIQQALLPIFPATLGGNEHRLPGSRLRAITYLNEAMRGAAEEAGVDILSIDDWVSRFGLGLWHDPVLWHRAKQEISPAAAPFYGELVGRIVGARQGRSSKCLVLDLDNTLWGGVIGDDGLEGIVLGQGSAAGEAFLVLQNYALDQAKRGILLAVCSKNDESNAFAAFDSHPEMVLKRSDIACFVANWEDKAKNLRAIANQLNIGLDSLVFADDNPFERNLVRAELPMVAVPELPDDPALMARMLADAGYFEGLGLTDEDRDRTRQYQAQAERHAFEAEASDVVGYMRSLGMTLSWGHFNKLGLPRIHQLINKTNQFNLTTRRYTEEEVRDILGDSGRFGLQFRLVDRFGDNGIIAILIVEMNEGIAKIDTWLMSCRVLGRQVEEATLNVVAGEARRWGARALVGTYIPTAKNGMVAGLYERLGFEPSGQGAGKVTQWRLDLEKFTPRDVIMDVREVPATPS